MWKEWQSMPDEFKNRLFMKKSLVGKWHYHYENKNGRIGLIRIQCPKFNLKTINEYGYVWEGCGVLDFERFGTMKEAEKAIYKALKEKRLVNIH